MSELYDTLLAPPEGPPRGRRNHDGECRLVGRLPGEERGWMRSSGGGRWWTLL